MGLEIRVNPLGIDMHTEQIDHGKYGERTRDLKTKMRSIGTDGLARKLAELSAFRFQIIILSTR